MSKPDYKVILVIDDESDLREILKDLLENTVTKVIEAANVQDALDILSAKKVDLIISDIDMPGKSGIDLLKEFRRCDKITPFIVITGGTKFSEQDVLSLGANAFVQKPNIPVEALLKLVG